MPDFDEMIISRMVLSYPEDTLDKLIRSYFYEGMAILRKDIGYLFHLADALDRTISNLEPCEIRLTYKTEAEAFAAYLLVAKAAKKTHYYDDMGSPLFIVELMNGSGIVFLYEQKEGLKFGNIMEGR
jgi:hypothetical protein